MDLRSIIVKGKCFIPLPEEKLTKEIGNIRRLIIDFLHGEGYTSSDPMIPFHSFLSMTFLLNSLEIGIGKPTLLDQIKMKLRLQSEEETNTKMYFKTLKSIKYSAVTKIIVYIYIDEHKNTKGISIEVTSIPAMYLKITQGLVPRSVNVTEEEYSSIIIENTQIVEKIARAIHGMIIEQPKPLKEYFKTQLCEKLEELGFKEIADLLGESKTKIETGKIKEGLDDLRGVLENFLVILVKKIGKKPKGKPKKDLELLEKEGYIPGETKGIIHSCLINGVYSFLSSKIHPREETDLFTARLCLAITEEIIDNLTERIIRYQIRKEV